MLEYICNDICVGWVGVCVNFENFQNCLDKLLCSLEINCLDKLLCSLEINCCVL